MTTHHSWGSRLGGSLKAILFGLVLFVGAFPVLFCNEARAVRTARSLSEGGGAVVSTSPDAVDPSLDGKLVHLSAFTRTEEQLEDATFGVQVQAIRLMREVEMFQWTESSTTKTEKNLGGSEDRTTTYRYEKGWSERLIDSTKFQDPNGHGNPSALGFESRSLSASRVSLGAYEMAAAQVDKLRSRKRHAIQSLPASLGPNARVHDGGAYIGKDPSSPEVGDMRVRFYLVEPGPVSVVAQQIGSSFQAYQTNAGDRLLMVEESVRSAESMFESAKQANTTLTWILRILGFVMMFIGLATIFRPIAVFGDVVPMVGNLVGAGIGLSAGVVAFFFSVGTIAVSWILVRPLLGIFLGAVAAASLVWVIKRARAMGKAKASAPAPATPPVVPPLPPIPPG